LQSLPLTRKKIAVLSLGELLAVVGATAVLYRPPNRADFAALRWLAVGTFAAAVADFVYEHAALTDTKTTSITGDLLLALAATLLAQSGVAGSGTRGARLLTDMVMPNLGGAELVKRIRAEQPNLPILCMSGHHEIDTARRQALWSTAQFIAKPATPDAIVARIRSMLTGVGPAADPSPT
jgi:CheY-like chemotaxis protein